MVAEYYKLLDRFTELCGRLVDQGQPYLTIILCHELFRFTYPFEPYAKFINDTNPVAFITGHIRKLVEVGEGFRNAVTPYTFMVQEYESHWRDNTLATATANLYSDLWKAFDTETLTNESLDLLKQRLPETIIEQEVKGASILDMGCGSGRYSIALARLGAKEVVGVDIQEQSFATAKQWCREKNLPVEFKEANFHQLPFDDESFDFVFSNGVLMHSGSIEKGLAELSRVLRSSHKAFLYVYAIGGIFWTTRQVLRQVFTRIPLAYTRMVLQSIGLPSNRFIFCDTWYVPLEVHTATEDLHRMLDEAGFTYEKVVSRVSSDLDRAVAGNIPGAKEMWGEGDHRYILEKL
ncbi:MAG TPA: class I SAM-dependent methyltransferase [Pyrinomonadaceae bacterium]|nr:class I SAM-dependent methyltransferase [Pyrinomonadaceae bacterium]